MTEWSTEPILDALNLLRWALFNFLIGNADAHAKNLSFLYRAGAIRLAPFYDLLSNAVYPRINNKFAMKMGGQKDPRYLMATHLSAFAAEAGVGVRAVKGQLRELCDKVTEEIDPLARSFMDSNPDAAIVSDITRISQQRVRKAQSLLR